LSTNKDNDVLRTSNVHYSRDLRTFFSHSKDNWHFLSRIYWW